MLTLARTLRLLAIILWLGGILFFGAVLAPTAFRVLPSSQQAGLVVGASLHTLHAIGLWCGVAIILALRLLKQHAYKVYAQIGLAIVMMALTYASNIFILIPMEHDRAAAAGYISALMPDSPLRRDFDARHAWSTRVEGAVLLAGLALTILIAAEPSGRKES
jgi:uncharacterized membrane protein